MYIGNNLQVANPSYKIIDDISSGFNGSTTSFALQVSGATPVPFPISTQQVMISVNGVVQEPDPSGSAGFKLLGSNIVFSSAPANGHAFFGTILAGSDYVTAGSEFPDGSVTAPSFTFEADQDSGWYRIGSGSVGYSANGVQILDFDGNGLNLPDNKKVQLGTSSDLQLYHNGSHSYLDHTGTGDLWLRSTPSGGDIYGITADNGCFVIQNASNAVQFISCSTGSVELYENGTKRFETSATGATVTGTLVADGLTVDTSTLHVDATNNRVGIGTTSPSATLDLQGSATTDGVKIFGGSSGNNSPLKVGVTDGTEYFRVNHDGKVGIGTTSPTDLLTISHAANSDDGISIVNTNNTQSSAIAQLELSGGDNAHSRVQFECNGKYSSIRHDGNGNLSLYTDGSNTALTLDSSQNATFAGNIRVNDSKQVQLGTGSDTYMWHDGSNGYFRNTTGSFYFQSKSTENAIRIVPDGEVALFYNDGERFRTLDTGARFLSAEGGVCDIEMMADEGDDNADKWRFQIDTSGNFKIDNYSTGSWVNGLTVNGSNNATFAGTVSDSKGNLRSIPANEQNGSYTLVAADAGKVVRQESTGVTINTSVMTQGAVVTIINHSGSDQTITQGSGFTLYNTADASTGNRTLAQRGMATIWYSAQDVGYISGAGLS